LVDLKEIQRKCFSNNTYDREEAAILLKSNFESLDKIQAWEGLHRLVRDKKVNVRIEAAKAMGNVFQYLPNEQKAWEDLNRLIWDIEPDVRKVAIATLGIVFKFLPDKQKSSEVLHKLISEKDIDLLEKAIEALGIAFQYVLDKQQALEDLHRLTNDEDRSVRWRSVEALSIAFQYVPNKQQALEDLHRLTNDEDRSVRWRSVEALGIAFQYVPDKQQSLEELHRLTYDKDSSVRWKVAEAIGTVFQHVPDKEQAWKDLPRLTSDGDILVRVAANHSLGRISIYKASQSESEEEYLEELKKAIEFFGKVAIESTWFNPSKFCFPFYRSFYTIISAKKREARDEVAEYLSEAKNAIEGSENKKLLFEAVENLANALKEVQNLENMDLEIKKEELNFYRKYCEQAAELMKDTEKTAPSATTVMRKGLPLIDRKLKSLLEEIQEKAKTACWESRGTDTEEIACAVKDKVQSIEVQDIESVDPEQLVKVLEEVISVLNIKIPSIPENEFILNKLQSMKSKKASTERYTELPFIISLIPTVNMMSEQSVKRELNPLSEGIKEINEKLDHVTISLKSGISQELVITAGGPIPHFSIDHVVTISLQEISYPELEEDLEKIKGEAIDKLSKLPKKLGEKVEGHLIQNRMYDVLKKLI
jgi:HEAT repeat protein